MTPQTTTVQQEDRPQASTQEQFVRQVEDHSLPAQQVLVEQQDLRASDDGPRLFVP